MNVRAAVRHHGIQPHVRRFLRSGVPFHGSRLKQIHAFVISDDIEAFPGIQAGNDLFGRLLHAGEFFPAHAAGPVQHQGELPADLLFIPRAILSEHGQKIAVPAVFRIRSRIDADVGAVKGLPLFGGGFHP